MAVPFEPDLGGTPESLVTPTRENVLVLLQRAAADLHRLERISESTGSDAMGVVAASQAIHVALIELAPAS